MLWHSQERKKVGEHVKVPREGSTISCQSGAWIWICATIEAFLGVFFVPVMIRFFFQISAWDWNKESLCAERWIFWLVDLSYKFKLSTSCNPSCFCLDKVNWNFFLFLPPFTPQSHADLPTVALTFSFNWTYCTGGKSQSSMKANFSLLWVLLSILGKW